MTPERFNELASQGYNRLPVMRKILADLDTPLTTYLKLANQAYTYLLESVEGGEKWGRYSIIGLQCLQRIQVKGNTVTLLNADKVLKEVQTTDPLQFIEDFAQQYHVPELPELPRCCGGLVGYFGYDTVRYVEPKLAHSTPTDDLGLPDILLMVSEELVVFDNLSGTLTLIAFVDPALDDAYAQGNARLDELQSLLDQPADLPPLNVGADTVQEQDFKSCFGEQAFKASVDKVKEYILAGDTMQVVLSQRMQIPFAQSSVHLYRALRCLNPSPYMFLLNMGEFDIVGSSPEILVRAEDGEVTVRPIAGTRPRGMTNDEDVALEQDLLADPKERAEHLMLIDLGRNDVGRIAQTGTVKVTDQMVVERYSHVMHIVSNVIGKLDKQHSAMDVLRATLPAGTLSGAPKIRAMEIIDEFEPVKRGVYGGAVGYLAWNGSMDTAIAIRTAVIKDQQLYVQAGAGLVADSKPQAEWDETMNKGRAIFRAAAMVQNGLKVN